MLSVLCNSSRRSLSHAVKRFDSSLRRFATLPGVHTEQDISEVSLLETAVPKQPKLIIKCKNESLNFYAGQTYDKFSPVPLASKGWRHRKSINDSFILYPDGPSEKVPMDQSEITFEDSDLNPQLIENLKGNHLTRPSAIQRVAIPTLLSGKNSIIAAETGCGKTLAYMLPMLHQIVKWKTLTKREMNEPLGLILTPNRDLAQQLGIVAKKIAANMDLKIRVVVGGNTKRLMLNPLVEEVDLLIGSLGAISKLTTMSVYKTSALRHVVLDEADTLLDDSFTEKLRHFLKRIKFGFAGPETAEELPNSAQFTIVSATMPKLLPQTLDEIINTESLQHLTTEHLHKISPHVPQKFLRLNRSSRPGEILRIVKGNVAKRKQTLVFCNTIKTCEWLYLFLNEMGICSSFTHGDLRADARSDKFAEFQRGHTKVLATTDACSRGLDTVYVNHVVNFDFPLHMADYIHRCGRTGRLGSKDKCYVTHFISGVREIDLLQKIETSIRTSTPLPNVDGNITKIIKNKIEREINRQEKSFLDSQIRQHL